MCGRRAGERPGLGILGDQMMTWQTVRRVFGAVGLATLVAYAAAAGLTGSALLDARAAAQTQGQVPGNVLGNQSDSDLWRKVRRGAQGTVSIPDKQAGVLVQAEGDQWRMVRGPISTIGGWSLAIIIIVIAIYRSARGRVIIDDGPSGRTVVRFNGIERFTHWLTASSFIVLALTGLNVLYGKTVLMPVIGKSAFATFTLWGKVAHNFIGFAFMAGVVLMVVLWVKDNFPDKSDIEWLSQGGGLLSPGVHPPAKKFNAGQKIIFWSVVIVGGSLGFTGLSLMMPFTFEPFGATFAALNLIGFDLPTNLTALQETQLSQLWHNILALAMTVIIIGHIYIGTPLGMEGAFDAMSTGEVDENWAKQHHSLWVEEAEKGGASADSQPAE